MELEPRYGVITPATTMYLYRSADAAFPWRHALTLDVIINVIVPVCQLPWNQAAGGCVSSGVTSPS